MPITLLYEELALAKQKFGRVPCRSGDEEKRDENKLRQQIEGAKKTGGINEVQYLSLVSAAKVDGHRFEEFELAVQKLGRAPRRSMDEEGVDENSLWLRIEHAKKTGAITEEQYRSLMRKRPQPDDVPLSQHVKDLMSGLEAFKAEHGKYPTSNKPGVPGKDLHGKRARLLKKQDLTTAQVEALKNTQCFQRQKLDTYDDFMQAVLKSGSRKSDQHKMRSKIEKKYKAGVLSKAEYLTLKTAS